MDSQKSTSMLFSLVMTFQAAAMQQMGKIKNPITDKIEKDLAQAQLSIDILDMLEEKTRGNLSPEEEKFLKNIIKELKLNYVDEINKPQNNTEEKQ